jgi:Carboxypeptidase regulatory-like domain/TonB-dependent Receptor Plug Domain
MHVDTLSLSYKHPKIPSGRSRSFSTAGLRRLTFALLSALLLLPMGFAQTSNAILNGSVKDQAGNVIANATVTATNVQTGIQKGERTDDTGRYAISNLAPGIYDIEAAQQGFSTILRHHQELLVGTTITLDFSLSVSSVSQTVEVQAESPVQQTTQNSIQEIMQTRQLDNLPLVTRSFSDLAALTPGVLVGVGTVSSANISINNAPVGQTGYLLDGHSNENDFFGGQFVNVAQDWIQEFSVLTNQFPVEYGNAAAGFVSAVTRSGTNDLHGRVYGFFQDAALNATPSFLPAFAPNKPPYSSQRVGGQAGGPIKKDTLFYFAGFEYYKNNTSIPIVVPTAFQSTPGSSGVYPQTNTSKLALAKLDFQPDAADSFHLRSNLEYDNAINSGIGAAGSLVHVLGNSTNGFTPVYLESLSWTRTLSASSLNEVYFLFQKNGAGSSCNYQRELGPYQGGGDNTTPYGNPVGYYAQITYASAGVVTGCPAAFSNMNQVNGKLGDIYTFSKGNHTIKAGIEIDREHIYTNHFRNNYDGQYVIAGTKPFTPGVASTYPLSLYSFYQPIENTSWDFPTWEDSLFVQDSWRISDNLTLNPGLRYDVSFSNSEYASEGFTPPNSQGHKINNDYGDIAPRLGVAWTPFRDNKSTVLRGGLGLFYDQDHLQTASAYISGFSRVTNGSNLNATRPSLNPYCLAIPSPCQGSVPAVYASAVEEVLGYALANYSLPNFAPAGGQIMLGGVTYEIPALPTVPGPGGSQVTAPHNFVFNIDKNFKVPASIQGTIGAQRQFGEALNISVDFAYSKLYNGVVLQNSNINPVTYGLIDPNYILVESFTSGANVWSKHLLLHAGYNSHRKDTFQVSYSYGYGTDNAIGGFITGSHTTQVTDPFDYNVDKGPSPNDVRHNLTASGLVHVPLGIEVAPTLFFSTALPYTASTTQTTPGCLSYYAQCYPVGYTRNSLRGDDTFQFNSRISKSFHISEKYSAMVLFEGFNLTNKLNTGVNFQGSVLSPSFKKPTGQFTARRQLQAGFRFDF